MSRALARSIVHFLRQEDGFTAVECALVLALVVIICFAALKPAKLPEISNQTQIETAGR